MTNVESLSPAQMEQAKRLHEKEAQAVKTWVRDCLLLAGFVHETKPIGPNYVEHRILLSGRQVGDTLVVEREITDDNKIKITIKRVKPSPLIIARGSI